MTSKAGHTAGPPLPNLARQFDLMHKGCRANGLHSWEDHFFMLYEEASKGAINIDEIAETIDYDYRNGNDGRAALDQLLTAIFADIRGLAEHRIELLTTCELFTKAAHDARDALNSRGIACPASIALAAEKARAALAKATAGGAV